MWRHCDAACSPVLPPARLLVLRLHHLYKHEYYTLTTPNSSCSQAASCSVQNPKSAMVQSKQCSDWGKESPWEDAAAAVVLSSIVSSY